MIGSLLIANRGEIACRIIRTARRLGVRTVAVYSDADATAPHVRQADAAVRIGPAAARESYLVGERLLDAARETGAEAIHPGYGFLSENADFAAAVIDAGLIWVGPPPAAIRAMGLKDSAKRLMRDAGVPVTPGYLGDNQDAALLEREAAAIGYPVLIKAVAGGGGKGMRRVESDADFATALSGAQREAAASFGDARVLIEKYVTRPRHIEVQIFADSHGNVVHLYERDCSLQRRHQKVIEEAPAPGMDQATREAVCAAAISAARAVGYEGAGTVEFIADASDGLDASRIWFMEMNTRLQVEHPVTEAVTGQDLVEWQLRIASGEALPLRQEQIRLSGHAIEARLYAENPATGFLPSIGPLTHFRLPHEQVRVDSGVEEGGEISPFYDPMIAKLITHAETRSAAAADLARACAAVEIWPVRINAGFLTRCLRHPDFIVGDVDTGFISERLETLVDSAPPPDTVLAAAAERLVSADPTDPWTALTGFRLNAAPSRALTLRIGAADHRANIPDTPSRLTSIRIEDEIVVFQDGNAYGFRQPYHDATASAASVEDGKIRAPMPGRIVAVAVVAGDAVASGAALVTLEAMKMEHTLKAPFEGRVDAISVAVGQQVTEGTVLVVIQPQQD